MSECRAFYAYPSKPEMLSETVEEAIRAINGTHLAHIIDWSHLRQGGKLIISQICREIDKADLFVCDVSGLNPNVMFELGFAIAKDKRIWITLDETRPENRKLLSSIEMLSSVGYRPYKSHRDILASFLKEAPYADLENTLLQQYAGLVASLRHSEDTDIFYLKSLIEHTPSIKLTEFLLSLNRQMVIDDPLESSYEPLTRYLSRIVRSRIVIVHLLSNTYQDCLVGNARYSLYAGIAYGFDRQLLIVAPEPFDAPVDYRNLLMTYQRARECVDKVTGWIYPLLSRREPRGVKPKEEPPELTLLRMRLGDATAEYEEAQLGSYFVETGQYREGLQTTMGVFVGKKGTGKTANLIRIRDYFTQEKSNFVIVIKPISFKLESYVRLVETHFHDRDTSADLTERIWRFLIYTEIAVRLYNKVTTQPAYYERTEPETKLINYVENNLDIVTADLGEKVDYIWQQADSLMGSGKNPRSILGIIFSEHLSQLRKLLQGVLRPYQRVIVLVDNLDKAWDLGRDLSAQGKIIYGLLGFQHTLETDLQWPKGETRLLVFLREDIFDLIIREAREPDKIRLCTHKIGWNDPELLLRVIEERFKASDPSVTNDQVWRKYFCKAIRGTSTRDFIVSHIMPRPRDLIHVVTNAIDECINHAHAKVEEPDIEKALLTYFDFLLDNTVTEYATECPDLKEIVLCFFGCNTVLSWVTLSRKVGRFASKQRPLRQIAEQLIRASFLGVIVDRQPLFAHTGLQLDQLIRYLRSQKGVRGLVSTAKSRLVIHPAFASGLKLKARQASAAYPARPTTGSV